MRKTLTIRISNEIGNQMFMYASSFAIAKKLNRELYIDNETAFLSKKNISKYALDNFSITSNKANKNFKFIVNINKYGNTTAGTIPIALDDAVEAKMLEKNDIVLFAAFGGGFTWGSMLIKWS